MNLKKVIPPIIFENEAILVSIDLYDNISGILFGDFEFNQVEVAKYINFNEKTLSSIRSGRKTSTKVKESMKLFAYQGFQFLIKYHSDRYNFNKQKKVFEKTESAPKAQFENGTYYGFFKKSDEPIEKTSHFILIVEDKKVTVWSKYNITVGKLEYNDGTFFSLLRSSKHYSANFFIGKKTKNTLSKTFIGTWSTADNDICSALCLVEFIKDSPYTNLEIIEKNRKQIHKEILSKRPDDFEEFFREQDHKFITQKNNW